MSAATVLAWLAEHAPDLRLIEHSRSTATVAEAAEVIGVEPGRIAIRPVVMIVSPASRPLTT